MKTEIKKPYFWSGMSFHQRAGYLLSSKQARDYSEACSMLARQPRRKRLPPQPVKEYWYSKDNQ